MHLLVQNMFHAKYQSIWLADSQEDYFSTIYQNLHLLEPK